MGRETIRCALIWRREMMDVLLWDKDGGELCFVVVCIVVDLLFFGVFGTV